MPSLINHPRLNELLIEGVFYHRLEGGELNLLENGLQNSNVGDVVPYREFQALICVMRSDKKENPDDIINFAKSLSMSSFDIAKASIFSARIDVVESIRQELSEEELRTLLYKYQLKTFFENYHKGIDIFIEGCGLEELNRYLNFEVAPQQKAKNLLTKKGWRRCYQKACGTGNLEVVERLEAELGDALDDALSAKEYSAYTNACESGNLDLANRATASKLSPVSWLTVHHHSVLPYAAYVSR